MKLELNPNKMTISELTDCIKELSAQRARLVEEKRQQVELALNVEMTKFLNDVNDSNHICYLNIRVKNGRKYRMPLNMYAIKEWQIEVEAQDELEDNDDDDDDDKEEFSVEPKFSPSQYELYP